MLQSDFEKRRVALNVALNLASRMRGYFRDFTYGNAPRTYADPGPDDSDFIEYIPGPAIREGHPSNVRYVECQKCSMRILSRNYYGDKVSTAHRFEGVCDGHTVPLIPTGD